MIFRIAAIFVVCLLFFTVLGCRGKKAVIEETPPMTEQTIEKFTITETELGKLKMILESDLAIVDEVANIAVLKFPRIKFYDKGQYSSSLISESVRINLETYDIVGTGKCVVNTVKNESLQTTNLQYDAKRKKIFSNEAVEITRGSEIIYGDSFEADPDLENIIIKRQRGVFNR
jgi:LPS export ABC transporter protein LptC